MSSQNSHEKTQNNQAKLIWISIIVLVIFLYFYSDNRNKKVTPPYEILTITGYGENGQSMENNDYTYTGGAYSGRTYKLGENKCTKTLKNLKSLDINISMRAFNNILNESNDVNDIPVAMVKLQCKAYYGEDLKCKAKLMDLAEQQKSREDSLYYMLMAQATCHQYSLVGPPRIIHFE
jgi:hypothetical protein